MQHQCIILVMAAGCMPRNSSHLAEFLYNAMILLPDDLIKTCFCLSIWPSFYSRLSLTLLASYRYLLLVPANRATLQLVFSVNCALTIMLSRLCLICLSFFVFEDASYCFHAYLHLDQATVKSSCVEFWSIKIHLQLLALTSGVHVTFLCWCYMICLGQVLT
jgi:hypothetical protein